MVGHMKNGMGNRGQSWRDVCLLPAQREEPDNEGNPPSLAVSPLQSSFKLPRLPVFAVQKDSAEAGEGNNS